MANGGSGQNLGKLVHKLRRKMSKIKQHFKDHKEAYIAGGVCLATGVVLGAVTILVVS